MTLDFRANAFGNLKRRVDSRFRQDHHELIAAITHKAICIAYRWQNHRGNFHQRMRANQMSVQVIYPFEIVQIEKHSRYVRSVSPGAFELIHQKLTKIARVMQLCEIVRER